jgi:molybdopterin-guanine dinucleotide biosynthesis protein A
MIKPMGFIAAGGRSSRMGRDKAWLELGGRPMIEYLIDALQPVTSGIAIIANNEKYKRLNYPVFADTHEGIGPLEAIRTALVNSLTPYSILVGCDLPFVSSDLLTLLSSLTQKKPTEVQNDHKKDESLAIQATGYGLQTADTPLAIVPLNEEGRPEPLCAVYAIQGLPSVTNLIANGIRKVSFLFEQIPTRFVSFNEVRHLQNARLFFTNINTQEDFELAKKIVATGI